MHYQLLLENTGKYLRKAKHGTEWEKGNIDLNPFLSSATFHIETSHLICTTYQMTGFYMQCNSGLKWS